MCDPYAGQGEIGTDEYLAYIWMKLRNLEELDDYESLGMYFENGIYVQS